MMGVDMGEIQRRRANGKKGDEALVPDDKYTNPYHEGGSNHLVPNDEAWDKANPMAGALRHDGDIDIEASVAQIEKFMRSADKGNFFGFGKDGMLDGKELSEALGKLAKQQGLELPETIRNSLREMSQETTVKLDIQGTVDEARNLLASMDKNHDGGINARELRSSFPERGVER